MDSETLQQYARDPRNTRRRLQEADDEQEQAPAAVSQTEPKKTKKK